MRLAGDIQRPSAFVFDARLDTMSNRISTVPRRFAANRRYVAADAAQTTIRSGA